MVSVSAKRALLTFCGSVCTKIGPSSDAGPTPSIHCLPAAGGRQQPLLIFPVIGGARAV